MVRRFLRRWLRRAAAERGQALPLVLGFMALGALIVTPSLNLAATSLDSSRQNQQEVGGVYAADAGLEYVLWCLEEGVTPPTALAEDLNQHSVTLETEEAGEYTLYFGDFVEMGGHSDFIAVSGNATWDAGESAYIYTISVALTPEAGDTNVHLAEVGVRLPPGYSYVTNSAAEFGDNLDTAEPDISSDGQNAVLLRWQFGSPKPELQVPDSEASQSFYISGSGEIEDDYTWVVANRADIGSVSEISGTVYKVTATATHLSRGIVSAQIEADVIDTGSEIHLVTWKLVN